MITIIKRKIFCKLNELFNRLPVFAKSIISKTICKPDIDKTVSIAGFPLYKGQVRIGRYTYLNGNAMLENVVIGNFCSIGRDLSVISGMHDLNTFSTFSFQSYNHKTPLVSILDKKIDNELEEQITYIGNDVWIGSYVKIIGGKKIGNGAVIGANSLITKDVPDYAIVAGNPAKIIRYRLDDEKNKELMEMEWWNWSDEEIVSRIDELKLKYSMENK